MTPPSFKPATGTDDEWNEAFARVEDYFRAHRVHSRIHQSDLVYRILARAAEQHAKDQSVPPVTLAVREACDSIDGWLHHQIGEADIDREKAARVGRVAFLLADGPVKHPEMFLDNDLPADVRTGMRLRLEQSGPNMDVSSMVGRGADLGIVDDVVEFAWDMLKKSRLIRMLLIWACFVLALFLIFIAAR